LYYKAWAYFQTFQFNRSVEILEEAVQQGSANYSLIRLLGKNYLKTGQISEAYKLYEKVYSDTVKPVWLSNQLAELAFKLKKYEKSAAIYHALIQKDSMNYYYYKKMGDVLYRLNQHKQATQNYRKAIQLNKSDVSTFVKLGNLYIRMKAYEKAKNYAIKGLDKDSTNTSLMGIAGYSFFRTQKIDSALYYFTQTLEYGDSSKFNLKYTGFILYDQEQYDSSSVILKEAYKRDTTDVQVVFYLGSGLSRAGEEEVGLEYLFKAYELIQPDKNNLLNINKEVAESYKNMEQPERALFYYKQAYKIKPEPELAFHMAALYDYYLKKKKMALHYYEGFLNLLSGKDSIDNFKSTHPVTSGIQLSLKDLAKKRIKAINEEFFFKNSQDSIN